MLHFILKNLKGVGFIAILISVATWAMDIFGVVYECPYCRTQRTVIGLLGIMLLLPRPFNWVIKYIGSVIAFFGLSVGSTQHFGGWRKIMSGKFEWGEQWYLNPWMLSGFALFIIMGLILLIWSADKLEGE